jgi:hypothetical protein
LLCLSVATEAQVTGKKKWIQKFDLTFFSRDSLYGSQKRVNAMSKSGNAAAFIALGYSVDALNTMYEATKDLKYLKANKDIIENIINSSTVSSIKSGNTRYRSWTIRSENSKFDNIKGQDWMLDEGYVFRYVAAYLYLLKKDNILIAHPEYKNSYNLTLNYLEQDVWDKWQKKYQDNWINVFCGSRTHIGSKWASLAMYLHKLTNDNTKRKSYSDLYQTFDRYFKKGLKTVPGANRDSFYVWNATWDYMPQKVAEYAKKKTSPQVQDVSHGNQVIQYLLLAYEFNDNNWNMRDIKKLGNTVKYGMWDTQKKNFFDAVDGSKPKESSLIGTGKNQSDGWVKLAKYNKDLVQLYNTFYSANTRSVDTSPLNIQFYAAMALVSE